MIKKYFILSLAFMIISGCATSHSRILDSDESALKLRSIQSRVFDTNDQEKTLRTIISTMQDLSFVINKADLELGTISGTKLEGYKLTLNVTAKPKGSSQMTVRANATLGINPIKEPEPYQDFFKALDKAMFLSGQNIE
jgi:hypothetical protein